MKLDLKLKTVITKKNNQTIKTKLFIQTTLFLQICKHNLHICNSVTIYTSTK